jgi:membrane protease YdiL (CAAX protease family)
VFLAAMVGQIPLSIAVLFSGKMPQNNADLYSLFDSNVFLFFALLTFVFAFIGLYLVVEKLHLQKFISIITSRERLDWSRIFVSFGLWLIISVILFFASYFYDSSEIVLQFNLIPFAILCVITLILMPIQTTAEELLFRGYLMQGFYNLSLNKWFPLLMTSLIFGTMHIMNPEVEKIGYLILVYYIGTGLFLGIITLMDEGTELALGFHAANNIIASLLITTDYTVFQTHSIFKDISEPSINFEVFFPVLVLFPILLFYFSKKYKWNHWKEKLIGTKKISSL